MNRTTAAALSATLLLTLTGLTAAVAGDGWSRFRGPNGSGVVAESGLPVEFGPERGVVWSTEVPFGRSSPALADGRIFLTAVESDELVTMAVAADTGELLWRRGVERARVAELYHGSDSASSTPVTDDTNVYVFFHELGLISYDPAGEERWRVELGPFRNYYGIAASPVYWNGTVYMVLDQVRGSYLLALDAATGEERFRTARPTRVESYSTPILYPDADAPTELVVLGSSWVDAYSLDSGELRWSMTGVGVGPVSSPALAGDLLFVSAPDHASETPEPFADIAAKYDADGDGELVRDELEGYWMYNHFGFVDIDGSGAISRQDYETLMGEMVSDAWGIYGIRLDGAESRVLWNVRQSVPYIPSLLHYGGVVYAVKDTILTSLDASTGDVLKRGRLVKSRTGVNASPIGADGKLYFATTDGQIAVLSAGAEWEVLALNALDDEIHATPAIADGKLFVRTAGRLYCFAEETATASDSAAEPTR